VNDAEIIKKLKILNIAFKEIIREFEAIGVRINYTANFDECHKRLHDELFQGRLNSVINSQKTSEATLSSS
jgi:hypothetical protein